LAVTAVEHSADRLTSTPRLFGAGWDAVVPLDPGEPRQQLVDRLRSEPDVAGVGWLDVTGEEQLDGVGPGGKGPVEPQSYVAASGSITPTLVEGRLPVGPNEVAIGDAVREQLGAAIGDTISVSGYRSEVPFVVVGRVVNSGTNDLGNGFDVTEEGLRAITAGCPPRGRNLSCQIITMGLGVALRPGVDVAAAISRLREVDERVEATPIPSVVYNLRQIGATPWYLAGFLVVLGFSGLAHALMTGWRLNRHDIAITRALGQTPRQAASTVRWQALLVGAVGAVVGLAVGLIAGRLVWRRVAEGAGALVETVVPPWVWVAAPALAVMLTVGLMLVPAARMGGLRLAELLRTE
jgi:putative ABC transport system permease protein